MAGKGGGKRLWSLALWLRYVRAGRSPADVRRRLEAARAEARPEFVADIELIADKRIAELEEADAGAGKGDGELEKALDAEADRQRAGAVRGGGAWWW